MPTRVAGQTLAVRPVETARDDLRARSMLGVVARNRRACLHGALMADAPVWDVERMRPLVSEWDEALRAELPAYARLLPGAEQRGSVLRPPATVAAVVAAEKRLGVRLPASYRSFLLLADGADAGPNIAACRLRGLEADRDRLLGIDDVVAYAAEDYLSSQVNLWREGAAPFADRQEQPGDEPVEVFDSNPACAPS
jgi:hypothetical protein